MSDIDPIAHLSGLKEDLTPSERIEELTLLRPALAELYQNDRATFAVAAGLVKEKLGIGRRDLEASLKLLLGDEKCDSKPLPLARFAELVDLVEDESEVKFLIRSSNNGTGLHVETEHIIDGRLYVPPGKSFYPGSCPAPSGSSVRTNRTRLLSSTATL
ncbi:MAG: hypothetical protein HY268_14770 [Deltaproteobacteria bacterium]|nr:hypothetical protein [Deltaproteobacteria bacterium]